MGWWPVPLLQWQSVFVCSHAAALLPAEGAADQDSAAAEPPSGVDPALAAPWHLPRARPAWVRVADPG